MRVFEQSELTDRVLVALGYAVLSLRTKDADGRELLIAQDLQNLHDQIKKEKLDIRLVSRED